MGYNRQSWSPTKRPYQILAIIRSAKMSATAGVIQLLDVSVWACVAVAR